MPPYSFDHACDVGPSRMLKGDGVIGVINNEGMKLPRQRLHQAADATDQRGD